MQTDDTEARPTPSPEEQAWLDSCPDGDARTITHAFGEVSVRFTVDRRPTTSESTTIEEFAASTPFSTGEIREAMRAAFGLEADKLLGSLERSQSV